MSRVGKMPIAIPQGVDVAITEDQISVKGAKGTLVRPAHRLVKVSNESGKLSFAPADESAEANAMSGTGQLKIGGTVGQTRQRAGDLFQLPDPAQIGQRRQQRRPPLGLP